MDLWHVGALGMVETHGLAASIVAVDVMSKAAEVTVIGVRRIGGGLVAVSIIGDMASVTTAVEQARRAATAAGGTLTSTVIGRPAVPADLFGDSGPTDRQPAQPPEVADPPHQPPAPEPPAAQLPPEEPRGK